MEEEEVGEEDLSPSDFANLLLYVVQENKQLSSLGNVMSRLKYGCGSAGEPSLYCPRVVANIKYYLKLNAFGRHGLENDDDDEKDNENSNNNNISFHGNKNAASVLVCGQSFWLA